MSAIPRRTKIQDVAAAAGVAIKTVSRVLNNEPNVRDSTRERVLAVVRQLNYHPSLSARSLAGRRSYLIGLIYGNPSANYIVGVQQGAMARCREARFQVLMQQVQDSSDQRQREVLGLVDQTHVDGLVLTAPISEDAALIDALQERGVPFVRMSPDDAAHPSPRAAMDDAGAAREMTEYLIQLGHRRIGFIAGHPDHYASTRRLLGYHQGLTAHGLTPDPAHERIGAFTFESGIAAARELLTLAAPPTAIFASNDDMAAGVLRAAHELGWSVPARLSVAGFDDTYIARTVWPPLTSVHQPIHELAHAATDLLLQMLQTGAAPSSVLLEHRLVCRASTAPPGN